VSKPSLKDGLPAVGQQKARQGPLAWRMAVAYPSVLVLWRPMRVLGGTQLYHTPYKPAMQVQTRFHRCGPSGERGWGTASGGGDRACLSRPSAVVKVKQRISSNSRAALQVQMLAIHSRGTAIEGIRQSRHPGVWDRCRGQALGKRGSRVAWRGR
jgi:hypothetical protein